MSCFLPTIIFRHRKENRKKCTVESLVGNKNFLFLTYPKDPLPDLSSYFILDLQGEPLSIKDKDKGIFLLDATWRHAGKMVKALPPNISLRSLPSHYQTAYPRKQDDCPDPTRGLASIEALYLTFFLLEKEPSSLLDNYYWKEEFLLKNHLPLK